MVRDVARRSKKNGDSFLKLQLGDVTGAVEAVVWDGVDAAAEAAAPGSVVFADGIFSVDPRYGACVTIRSLRPALDGEYDPADLHDGPSSAYGQMVADLRELVITVQDRDLRGLLYGGPAGSPAEERRRSAAVTRQLRLLRGHGLIHKVPRTHRYVVSEAGRQALTALLAARAARGRRHRAHRRREASSRDPARLLHGPPGDRGHARLPARPC